MNEFSLANLGQPAPEPVADPPSEPRVWTQAELQAGVDAGTITQTVADQTLEDQRQTALVDGVTDKIQNKATAVARSSAVNSGIEEYVNQHPELKDKESAHFKKTVAEFNKLTDLGYDKDDPGTELLALKSAFGPATVQKGHPTFEVHQEGESGQGGSDQIQNLNSEGAGDPSTAPPGLSDRQLSHYTHLIDIGIMPDWNAVRAEQEHADPGIVKRASVMNA